MPLAVKVFLLGALVRLLLRFEKPFLCAGIYGIAVFFLNLALLTDPISTTVMDSALALGISAVYFLLLNRANTGSTVWWLIAVAGVPMVFI